MERKVIDLSLLIIEGMEVSPTDPPVEIDVISRDKNEGREIRHISLGSHTGTQVDVPSHLVVGGDNLSSLPIERFLGPACVVRTTDDFPKNTGLIFPEHQGITPNIARKILASEAPFIGTDDSCVVMTEAEKLLLQNGILVFKKLANTNQLPEGETFTFIGLPLNIADGDGSPIRAIAILERQDNDN